MTYPAILSGGRASPWLLFWLVLMTIGCKSVVPPKGDTIAERFAPQDRAEGDSVRRMRVERRGETKDAVVLLAPVAVSAPIAECRGSCVFRVSIAPVFNVGDGLEMDVWVSEGREPRKIYNRYFDPGRRFEDRRWIPIRIPVESRGSRARLEIRVTGGPRGDLTADWLALADMRISSEAEGK